MNEDPQPEHVTRWDVTEEDIPGPLLAEPVSERVYLLPDKTVDGIGVYHDDAAGLVKTLQHEGVDVEFAYPQKIRRYLSEYSATPVLTMIVVSVTSSLTTALIQSIVKIAWARARSAMGGSPAAAQVHIAQVTVKIAEIERTDAGTVLRGVEVTGPVGSLEELLRSAITGSQQIPSALPEEGPRETEEPGA